MAFETIEGQERAASLLRAALKTGWVPHAYLLVGPEGVGRTAMARELAAILLCSRGKEERCGKCRSCRAFVSGNHPDYFEVGLPEGKQSLPINAIRGDRKTGERGVQDEAAVKPVIAERRVFVVRDVERMSVEAANCFLKTLEEPPGDTRFILIAAGLADVPATIVSRCWVVKLSGLPAAKVEEQLRSDGAKAEDARWLAQRSWGSPGRARAFRDTALHEFNRQLVGELLAFRLEDNFRLSDWLQSAARSGESRAEARVVLQDLLECMALFYRDLAAVSLGDDGPLFNEDRRSEIRACAARLSLDQIVDCADGVLETIEHVGQNANSRLALDALFSRIGCICATKN